jgi:hypothetical protein
MREIARGISPSADGSDVVLIHSIPSGVIGLARYVQASVPLASWVEQLGNHRVPESLQRLVQGHSRIILVKLHEVGAAAPEEKWLRANAAVVNQQQIQTADVINFDLTMASVSSNERNGDSANNSLIPSDHL